MRILIAYDGSPDSELALSEVARRPWPAGSMVRIVTVVQPPVGMADRNFGLDGSLIVEWTKSIKEEAFDRLNRALLRFKGRGDLETSSEVREGSPKASLIEATREWGADLVVLGSQGMTRLERIFLGSVSHALVTYAPCSVEIIRRRPSSA